MLLRLTVMNRFSLTPIDFGGVKTLAAAAQRRLLQNGENGVDTEFTLTEHD